MGGISDYSFNLTNALKGVRDFEFFVISRKVGTDENRENIFYIISRKKVQRSLLQIFEEIKTLPRTFVEVFESLNEIKKRKPDIVHVQYEPGLYNLIFCPMLFTFLKILGIRIFLTLHSRDYFPLNIFHRMLLYRFADRILVHSISHKNLLNMKKVQIVPIGINVLNQGIFSKSKNIFFYGLLSPHKGLEFLVKSFGLVVKKFPSSRLLIFGNIDPRHREEVRYKEAIKKLIKSLDLTEKVDFFIKRISQQDIPKINSNIAVFPYKISYSASHSLALLECMAAGKAVVVTKIPGLSDEVNEGINGFVVTPESYEQLSEKILELLMDEGKLKRIMKNNFELAKKFSWENVARENFKNYQI